MGKFIDLFLEWRINSSDGDELRNALEATIEEEKRCLELFKIQMEECTRQLTKIDQMIEEGWHTHKVMQMRRAYEEYKYILNIAAQFELCSHETKGIQKVLYFETNENSKERIAVSAIVMMYEWCEDLYQLTGKQYQDMAKKLLSPGDLVKTRVARKKLGDFYEENKPVLSKVRHNIGAHRDHDFLIHMKILEEVGWSETIELVHVFEEVSLELGRSIKPLMDAGLKQIGEAVKS